ncbi:isoprenylcysteine carboxylmethyltransferase family protein [Histidinibacterium aquaticum]|uniref:Isoprenylcysteine carboxylmethyltransferase family protein n=2 Tax=Histidinibacterium aquaticum TaxID=2613962 RepID=A0A5J5GST0_9RHOB|nr:isoprenylcysteine carboxylmethyltransferase family protein [Histidinibacterium aquaticum]
MTPLQWIDIPPVWLAGMIVLVWLTRRPGWILPEGMEAAIDILGWVLILAGLALLVLALGTMMRRGTSPVPHQEAEELVTSGVFRISRNPIYLGDTLILTGLIFLWLSPLALPLIPIFVWIVTRRFIEPEEEGLARSHPEAFEAYAARTRRWL